jgi:hypothetical protein
MEDKNGHIELTKREATQATRRPPTQYVLGFGLLGVVVAFSALMIYWAL